MNRILHDPVFWVLALALFAVVLWVFTTVAADAWYQAKRRHIQATIKEIEKEKV